jgi:hypothetical protein
VAFGYAPLPGDAAALEEMAGQWAGLAAELLDISHHLGYAVNQLSGDGGDGAGWSGRAASMFVEWWFNLQPDLFSIVSVCEEMEGTCRKLADAILQAQSYFRAAERTLAMGCPQYRLLTNLPSEPTRTTWVEDVSGKSVWPPVDDPLSVLRQRGDRTVDELQEIWRTCAVRFRAIGQRAQDLPAILRDATSARFARAGEPRLAPGRTAVGLQGADPTPPTNVLEEVKSILAEVGATVGEIALVTVFIPGFGEITLALEAAVFLEKVGEFGVDVTKLVNGEGGLGEAAIDVAGFVAWGVSEKVADLVKEGRLKDASALETWIVHGGKTLQQSIVWAGATKSEATKLAVNMVKGGGDVAFEQGRAAVQRVAGSQAWSANGPSLSVKVRRDSRP